jgi:hypothetical protein
MKKATVRLVTSAVAVLAITTTQLDVRAFAQEPRKDAKISVKIPMTLTPSVAKPAIRWSDRPSGPATPQDKGGSKKKWLLIAIAGGGGAVAAFLLMRKDTPVITVGTPTIGQQ